MPILMRAGLPSLLSDDLTFNIKTPGLFDNICFPCKNVSLFWKDKTVSNSSVQLCDNRSGIVVHTPGARICGSRDQ